MQVTGSAKFQEVSISTPSGTIERAPEVVQALFVRPHDRLMDALVFMKYTMKVCVGGGGADAGTRRRAPDGQRGGTGRGTRGGAGGTVRGGAWGECRAGVG